MSKNFLAAAFVAASFVAVPAMSATINDAIPDSSAIGKSIYVQEDGYVTLTYLGSDAGNSNFGYYVRDGVDQFLFRNASATTGETAVLQDYFSAGTEIIFALSSFKSTGAPATFLTGTDYAKAGMVDGYGFVIAFEDTVNGDWDYNDFVFSATNVGSSLPAVPVPAALPLLLSAFGGMALIRRRNKRA